MNTLTIPLSGIPGRGVRVEAEVPVGDLQPEGAEAVPAETASIQGTLQEVGGDYLFRGTIDTTYVNACDRCLEPAEIPVTIDVMWNFETDPAAALREAGVEATEEDLGDTAVARSVVNDEIHLAPHVWEEIALALPSKFICSEECQGLCPQCGANLNTNPCSCDPGLGSGQEQIRGLAELAKLFPKDTPGEPKS